MNEALFILVVIETLALLLLINKCLEQDRWIEKREVHVAELEMMLEQSVGAIHRTAFKQYPQEGDAK